MNSLVLRQCAFGVAGRGTRVSKRHANLRFDFGITHRATEFRFRLIQNEVEQRWIKSLRNRWINRGEESLVEARDLTPPHRIALRLDVRRDQNTSRHTKCCRREDCRAHHRAIALGELPDEVTSIRNPYGNRFAAQPAFEIVRKFIWCEIASRRRTPKRLQHDPIEVIFKRRAKASRRMCREEFARSWNWSVDDRSLKFKRSSHPHFLGREWTAANQRFEEHDTERPDVGAAVDFVGS